MTTNRAIIIPTTIPVPLLLSSVSISSGIGSTSIISAKKIVNFITDININYTIKSAQVYRNQKF